MRASRVPGGLCLCVCLCVCVPTCVSRHAFLCVPVCICLCVCPCVSQCAYVSVHVPLCVPVRMSLCVCPWVSQGACLCCIPVCICLCACAPVCPTAHVSVCVPLCVPMCMSLCVPVHMSLCVCPSVHVSVPVPMCVSQCAYVSVCMNLGQTRGGVGHGLADRAHCWRAATLHMRVPTWGPVDGSGCLDWQGRVLMARTPVWLSSFHPALPSLPGFLPSCWPFMWGPQTRGSPVPPRPEGSQRAAAWASFPCPPRCWVRAAPGLS